MKRIIVLAILIGSSAAIADVDRTELRKELAARRELNLKRFHDYRRARVYPHNSYEEGFINVWRDDDAHLCAIANLVNKDGLDDLVSQTARDDNFVKLADVSSGPLIDWVLTSGLTQEEVVMIQWPTFAQDDPVGYARMMRREREQRRARAREDQRLAAGYLQTERTLERRVVRDAALELAVARLAKRPDLAAALHAKSAARVAAK